MDFTSSSRSKRRHEEVTVEEEVEGGGSTNNDKEEDDEEEESHVVLYGGHHDFRPHVVGPPTPDQLGFRNRSQATFELYGNMLVDKMVKYVHDNPPTDENEKEEELDGYRWFAKEAKYLPACYEYHRLMLLNSFRYETEGRAGAWIMGCGDNEMGVLGRHLSGRRQNDATGIRILNPTLFHADIRQVSCGAMMSAVLSGTGIVYTFGSSDNGALGRVVPQAVVDADHTLLWEATPAPLDNAPPGIRQVACGNLFGVIVDEEGDVYTWGCYEDTNNQRFRTLPPTDRTTQKKTKMDPRGWNSTLVRVPGLKDIVHVYAGPAANFCYALDMDGNLYSWGFGNCGETGRIAIEDPTTGKPSAMYTLYTVEENEQKALREDVLQEFMIPKPVPIPSKEVISVACGAAFVLVVARNLANVGVTYAAGNNGFGQLGNGKSDTGTESNQHDLRPIKAIEHVNMNKVSAGDRHCLAVTQDMNNIYAWGGGDRGQLGLGKDVALEQVAGCVTTPTIVTFYDRSYPCQIVDIACGEYHSMALSLDGDVYTWGSTDGEDKMFTGHACKPGMDVYVPMKLDMYDPKAGPPMEAIDMAGGAAGSLFLVRARADPPEGDGDDFDDDEE